MRLTVEEIRRRYPNPKRPAFAGTGSYCVGGALVLSYFNCHEKEDHPYFGFPNSAAMAWVLRHANPNLGSQRAKFYAYSIMARNDHGNFEKAWNILDQALQYGRLREEEIQEEEVLCL